MSDETGQSTFRDAVAVALYGTPYVLEWVDGPMARRDASTILAMPEMQAIRRVLDMVDATEEGGLAMYDVPSHVVAWVRGK